MKYVYSFLCITGSLLFFSCEQESPYAKLDPFYGSYMHNDSLYEPVPQQMTERIYEPLLVEEGFVLSMPSIPASNVADSAMVMKMPSQVAVDRKEEFVYVMDIESYVINKFSLVDGSLQQTITTAKEHRLPHNYQPLLQVLSDGSIQVSSIGYREILKLHEDGSLKGTYKLPRGTRGYAYGMDTGEQLTSSILNHDELFHVLTHNGGEKSRFGVMSNLNVGESSGDIKVPGGHGLDFNGMIVTDGGSHFMYNMSRWGGLLGLDVEGNLRFYRETIAHRPFPRIMQQEEGYTGKPQLIEVPSTDARFPVNVWNGVYYQIVLPPCNAEFCAQSFIVDAYSYENGDYLYSLHTPANCGAAFITDTHMYANCLGKGLVQYKRRSRQSPFSEI